MSAPLRPAPPFRTEIRSTLLPSAAEALFRMIRTADTAMGAAELEALAGHPDERVPLALGALANTPAALDLVWRRALADLESEGVAWTPLFDSLSASMGDHMPRERADAIRSRLQRLADWLLEAEPAEVERLLAFRTPAIALLVAERCRCLTPELVERLAASRGALRLLLKNESLSEPARRKVHMHLVAAFMGPGSGARSNRPDPLLEALKEAGVTLHPDARQQILRNAPGLSEAVLLAILEASPEVTSGEIRALVDQRSPSWRVGRRPSASEARFRATLAAHPALPSDLLGRVLDAAGDVTRVVSAVEKGPMSPAFQQALVARLESTQQAEESAMRLAASPASTATIWFWAHGRYPESGYITRGLAHNSAARAVPELRKRILGSEDVRALKLLWEDGRPEETHVLYAHIAVHDPEWMVEALETRGIPQGGLPELWMQPLLGVESVAIRARAFALMSRVGEIPRVAEAGMVVEARPAQNRQKKR
jgi:hypothetical protein